MSAPTLLAPPAEETLLLATTKGESQVDDSRILVLVEEDVVRFQIAMLHPWRVHVRKCRRDLPCPLLGLRLARPLAGSERAGHPLEAL